MEFRLSKSLRYCIPIIASPRGFLRGGSQSRHGCSTSQFCSQMSYQMAILSGAWRKTSSPSHRKLYLSGTILMGLEVLFLDGKYYTRSRFFGRYPLTSTTSGLWTSVPAVQLRSVFESLPKLNVANAPKKKQVDPSSLSERDRISIPAAPAAFTFRNYVSYALYSPLFIAGPIITFNDYISQTRYPSPSLNLRRTLLYGVRFLLTLISMELILHYIYAVAISKSNPDWNVYTPFQLSMLGYFNLHIIWLKLLLPWRFFRLWALIDGIDPPENTIRCMSDNYSTLAFWRGWHRSFNRWTVRYLYVPLGGGAAKGGISRVRATLNMLAVFSFIALWHDIQLRLLMWGWMATLFVLPEMLATVAFPKSRWEQWPNAYRVLCGVGAVGNILMLMAANLVGFAVGLDGLKGLVGGILGSLDGLLFFLLACSALFVGVQVMFEIRAEEARKGIKLKC